MNCPKCGSSNVEWNKMYTKKESEQGARGVFYASHHGHPILAAIGTGLRAINSMMADYKCEACGTKFSIK
jgi:transposase-like protein